MEIARVEAGFEAAVARALAVPGTRAAEGWTLRIPPLVRETMRRAAVLADGRMPETLAGYYGGRMPEELVDQLFRGGDGRELLWRRLAFEEVPILAGAVEGVVRELGAAGLSARTHLGAADARTLLGQRPSVAELFAPSLFGSGLPFLGAHAGERALMREDLAGGGDPAAVIDRRLSGNLLHELCHGLARECAAPAGAWLVIEAAALTLGARARPRHVFPHVAGEAVPGVALFVMLGEGLARLFGARALFAALAGGPLEPLFGARTGAALTAAAWQDWLARTRPPFAADALSAETWLKLADASRGSTALDGLLEAARTDDVRGLPSLAAAANRLEWQALPWWTEEVTAADLAMLATAVDAMLQVNVLAPIFATVPAEPPGRRLMVDLAPCRMRRARHPDGVFGEPAAWLVPPPVARSLCRRGAEAIRLEGVTLATRGAAAEALVALVHGDGPLAREVVLGPFGAGR